MKSESEVVAAVRSAFDVPQFGMHGVRPFGVGYELDLPSCTVTFAALARLSDALGTKLIDLHHEEGEGSYSDLTPGWPGKLTLRVRFTDQGDGA